MPDFDKAAVSKPAVPQPGGLPRRDFFLLPVISFLTIALLLLASEATARWFFHTGGDDTCLVADSNIGFRYRPNCTSRLKAAEGPWVENYYNDCGYRTSESCGLRKRGTIRIALIGSSTAESFLVPYDQTLSFRLGKALTQSCGRPAEVQNLGREQCFPTCSFRRMDEALALKPDVVLLAFSPFDLENLSSDDVANRFKPMQNKAVAAAKATPMRRLQLFISRSYAVIAMEHFIFQDPATYLRMALNNRDTADYMRPQMSLVWDKRLANFDLLLGEMAQKANAAGVPFAFMEIPSLAQASVLSAPNPPAGVDVYSLNQRLNEISAKHGIQFINGLGSFEHKPGTNKLFYVVDGHLGGPGQALLVNPLVRQLTEGANPPLAGCNKVEQPHGEGF